jgi:uncharacterized protein
MLNLMSSDLLCPSKSAQLTRFFRHFWLKSLAAIASFLLALMCAGAAFAQQLQPVPPLTSRVTDLTLTLGTQGKAALEAKLADIEARRGSQIAVLLVGTLNGEPIEDFANRVGTAWKIGRKGVGDGVLIVLAVQDRKVRIDVARSLEGAIPDVTAKRIITETMAPAFKAGDYAGGLIRAVERIDERLAKEADAGALPAPTAPAGIPNPMDGGGEEGLLAIVIFGIFAGVILKKILGGFGPMLAAGGAGTFAAFAGNPLFYAIPVGLIVMIGAFVLGAGASRTARKSYGRRGSPAIFFPSGGSGGGWSGGGSSGGGGWSSGGGGDFSGGGASGDW